MEMTTTFFAVLPGDLSYRVRYFVSHCGSILRAQGLQEFFPDSISLGLGYGEKYFLAVFGIRVFARSG
jgi:hypothetical protein